MKNYLSLDQITEIQKGLLLIAIVFLSLIILGLLVRFLKKKSKPDWETLYGFLCDDYPSIDEEDKAIRNLYPNMATDIIVYHNLMTHEYLLLIAEKKSPSTINNYKEPVEKLKEIRELINSNRK